MLTLLAMDNFRVESVEIDGANYTCRIDDDGRACIAQCKAALSCLRIPDRICGCPVTSIGEAAFSKLSHVENVVCPRCLEHISARAFEGCLKLRSITLNNGLRTIDEEAFFLCTALEALNVPATVKTFGPRPLGTSPSRASRGESPFEIRFAPESDHLFFDEDGVLYERRSDGGLTLVDGYRFKGEVLACNPDTVEIGARSLNQMPNLKRVVLPHGLRRIGDEAFRGDTKLERLDLPDTLESIGKAAFSSTSIRDLRLPASCVDVDDSAFTLGTIASDGSIRPYRSSLESLYVDSENAVFRMAGNVLCKHAENGGLEALLAPGQCRLVEFDARFTRIHATTLAGTACIDTLHLVDGAIVDGVGAYFSDTECHLAEITLSDDSNTRISLYIPSGHVGKALLAESLSGRTFSANAFLQRYDEAIGGIDDGLEQARLVIARLADPAFLSKANERALRDFAHSQLPEICASFGERGEFEKLEWLVDSRVLDEQLILEIADKLAAHGDSHTVGYLLEMKRRRFGAPSWSDYDV